MTKVQEFIQVMDYILGVYCDSTYGFHLQLKDLEIEEASENVSETHAERVRRIHMLDSKPLGYSFNGVTNVVHQVPRGVYKLRNTSDGINYNWAAKMAIVSIYAYWDSTYREAIARELGFTKDKQKKSGSCKKCGHRKIAQTPPEYKELPEFDELRLYRNSVIHADSIASKVFDSFKHFTWFKDGQVIRLDFEKIKIIFEILKSALIQHQQKLP